MIKTNRTCYKYKQVLMLHMNHSYDNPKMIVDEVPCVVVDEEYPAVCVDPLLPALWQWTQVVLVPS